jgi:hypothetical protein
MTIPIVLLDSGAFSAWTKGRVISIRDYIAFLKTHAGLVSRYVALDSIAGSDGEREYREDMIELATEQSYRNHQIMREAGLQPLPVFHQGERFAWLARYVRDGETYLCLAPNKRIPYTRSRIISWLDDCFSLLNDGRDKPPVKVHGLGVTALDLIWRYKWTSVDSSTWLTQSKVGQLVVPIFVDGKPDYSYRADQVTVTERSRGRRNHLGGIISDFDLHRLNCFLEQCGVTLEQVQGEAEYRWRVWLHFLRGLEEASGVEIFQVVGHSRQMRSVLRECGCLRWLISFDVLQSKTGKGGDRLAKWCSEE